MATATIFGASGLTGGILTEWLMRSTEFESVTIAVRKPLNIHNAKLRQVVIDFSLMHDYPELFNSDHIFCCLGTTMQKERGNRETYAVVDKQYPVEIAINSAKHRCKSLHIMSSLGADTKSTLFYSRLKGAMQEEVIAAWKDKVQRAALCLYQPGLLRGDRKEKRRGEAIGKHLMRILNPVLIGSMRKYRSIAAGDVAMVMMHNALTLPPGLHIFRNDKLLKTAKELKS